MTSPRSYLTRVALRGEVPMLVPPRRPGRLWSDPRFAVDGALDEPPPSIRTAAAASPDALSPPAVDAPVTPASGPRVARVPHPVPTAAPGHADAPATPVAAPVIPYTLAAAVIASAAARSEVSEVAPPVAAGRATAQAPASAPRAPGRSAAAPEDRPTRREPAESPPPSGRIAARVAAAERPVAGPSAAQRPAAEQLAAPARSTDVASAPAEPPVVVRTPPATPSGLAPRARPGRLLLGEALTAAFAWTSSSDDAPTASAKQPAPAEPPLLQIGAIDIEVVPPAAAPKSDPAARLARGYSRFARRG
jgi:hypothetical protein